MKTFSKIFLALSLISFATVLFNPFLNFVAGVMSAALYFQCKAQAAADSKN